MASKPFRPLSKPLRVFIAAGSVGAFLGGWALLAHSPNPYENVQAASPDAPVTGTQNNRVQLPALPTPRARTQGSPSQIQPQQQSGPQLLPNLEPQQQFGSQFGSPFRQRRMRSSGS
jgi:hypothetical protein